MPKTKPPTYVIELAKQTGGDLWQWKEYPADSKVVIILKDGRKFAFPMPDKPMSAGKSTSVPHSKSDGKSPAISSRKGKNKPTTVRATSTSVRRSSRAPKAVSSRWTASGPNGKLREDGKTKRRRKEKDA
jgi:hypothetical protein